MIRFAQISLPGSRPVNEDSVATLEGRMGWLFVLADGLGGHGSGEVASALAVAACRAVFEMEDVKTPDLLPMCIAEAQNALLKEQTRQGRKDDIKTTVTLLHIHDDVARTAHVGDSRIYTFRKGKIIRRTLDHSVPQMLVNSGEIKERDIRFHEDRNRLIRVLGMEWDVPKYELSDELMMEPPMAFLLCSDGFWELIDEKDMQKMLRSAASPQEWLAAMEKMVLKNGTGKNMDNYSAIAVFAD